MSSTKQDISIDSGQQDPKKDRYSGTEVHICCMSGVNKIDLCKAVHCGVDMNHPVHAKHN